jgi:hypothetical protein
MKRDLQIDGASILITIFVAALALVLLGVALIAFKLAHVITWPWLWVTLPFWGPVSLLTTVVVLVLLFAFVLLWLE